MTLFLSRLPSPLGELLLVTDEQQCVRALDFADHRARLQRTLRAHDANLRPVEAAAPAAIASALASYFDGELPAFHGRVACGLQGQGPDAGLQLEVWAALRDIPVGTTTTYGKLAKQLGYTDPRAAIAIGAANAANPIAIIVPCHRVIASNGELKGYAWGMHRKRWLLEHEGALATKTAAMSRTGTLPGFCSG